MRFRTDEHFVIGKQHALSGKPCQDYALTTLQGTLAAAIVSDGCSTGGATDVGARLLAYAGIRAIKTQRDGARDVFDGDAPQRIEAEQLRVTQRAASTLGLGDKDILATSCYAYLAHSSGGRAHLAGDGVIAMRFTDGTMQLSRFTWSNNIPCYPVYAKDGYAAFIEAHTANVPQGVFVEERWACAASGAYTLLGEREFALAEGIAGTDLIVEERVVAEKLDALAVFTDGVSQCEGLDWKDVVRELLSFKTTRGDFAKRRMNRFLKEREKLGQYPADDIAYAVILIEREGEEKNDEHTEQAEKGIT